MSAVPMPIVIAFTQIMTMPKLIQRRNRRMSLIERDSSCPLPPHSSWNATGSSARCS